MKVHHTYWVLLLVLTGMLASCKKDKDKKPTCRIVTILESGTNANVYNITYDNDGRISTFNTSGSGASNRVFTYSGNTINIHTTTNGTGTFNSRDSITIDNKRRPLNIRQFSDQSGTNWTNLSFEYNGDDLLKYIQTSSSSSTPETNTATSVNGNIATLQMPGSRVSFEYFTDKQVQPGDYLEILSLIQFGVTIYPHKNLIKSLSTDGGAISNINYDFDADGQITRVTITNGSTVGSLSYQYQCN